MQAELAAYQVELGKIVGGPRNVVAASVNGKSFSYGPDKNWSIEIWQAEIQDALSWVDDGVIALPSATRVRFS